MYSSFVLILRIWITNSTKKIKTNNNPTTARAKCTIYIPSGDFETALNDKPAKEQILGLIHKK